MVVAEAVAGSQSPHRILQNRRPSALAEKVVVEHPHNLLAYSELAHSRHLPHQNRQMLAVEERMFLPD
jgi:hypothetical protein